MFQAAVSEQKAACTKEPANNNEGGEKGGKKEKKKKERENMQGRAWGRLRFLWAPLLPVLLHPVLKEPPLPLPKEKLKAFFWKKSSLLRLLLFTFGRIAIGGEFKHRKRPLVTGRAADRPGRLATRLRGVAPFPPAPVRSPGT